MYGSIVASLLAHSHLSPSSTSTFFSSLNHEAPTTKPWFSWIVPSSSPDLSSDAHRTIHPRGGSAISISVASFSL